MSKDKTVKADCLIIGGGPAGLTAALYLARFRRDVIVIDGGASRAALIPVSHNFPGAVQGIAGVELLGRLRTQAESYGASIRHGEVTELRRGEDGLFTALTKNAAFSAEKVLIATGIVDEKPSFPSMLEFIYCGAVRFCPICDGYEAMDKRIGILGPLKRAVKKAAFLRIYSADIFVLPTDTIDCGEEEEALLQAAGLEMPGAVVTDINMDERCVTAIFADGGRAEFDILYPAMGSLVRSGIAGGLGAECCAEGFILTDKNQMTSVEGLYAAGDVTLDLSQISVGAGQAAVAATHMHEDLVRNLR